MRACAIFGTSALGRPSRDPVAGSSIMRQPIAASCVVDGRAISSTAESGSSLAFAEDLAVEAFGVVVFGFAAALGAGFGAGSLAAAGTTATSRPMIIAAPLTLISHPVALMEPSRTVRQHQYLLASKQLRMVPHAQRR